MSNRGGLAVYVTSHGFGHLNRTVAVLNRLPADLPLLIRCKPDLFAHWRERLTRPACFESHVSDVGALNPSGDSAATDGPATLLLAARVHTEAMGRIESDIAVLRDEGTAAVLCDATSVPLVAAKRAGVPGFLLANFTWAEIYEPHACKIGPDALRFVRELRAAYRNASHVFRAQPALAMTGFRSIEDVGLVVTPGRDRRGELRSLLAIPSHEKIVYFYVGRYGQANLEWDRLATMKGLQFVGFHAAQGVSLKNLHVVPATEWTGADLAASADAIVAKAGYGTVCEAMAAGTPMIYPPRVGFAEHRALDRALRAWGGGVPASSRAFAELRLESLLKKAISLKPGPLPFSLDGAERVARRLVEVCRASS
jgi:hypothetical protein